MTHGGTAQPSLEAVAALLSSDQAASSVAGVWIALNGEPFSPGDAELIDWATDQEWELAAALRGGRGDLSELDAEAIAGLLRLAAGADRAGPLRVGLRREFIDDDPDDRAAAFARLFRRRVMPGLRGADEQERAWRLLLALAAEPQLSAR
jgi:hypothetical protein